jgi:2-amino-4-hydroxy-6-hydroxymethyldihydropteridine diphosphokinase
MGTLALIGLGSNVGDRKAHLDRAVAALAETPGVALVAVSAYHETAPAGGPAGQGAFLNASARLDTDLSPLELLHRLLEIEAEAGRVRTVRWGERPLDLDLLIYGCKSMHSEELILPHPRMALRRFVLAPLVEIAPDIVDMRSGLSVAQLLANLDRRPSYIAIDAPPGEVRDQIYRRLVADLPSVGLPESEIQPGIGPEWIEAEDVRTHTRFHPVLKAKIRALEARHWEQVLGDTGWLVTDFCLTSRTVWYLGPLRNGIDLGPQEAGSKLDSGLLYSWCKPRHLDHGSVADHFRELLPPPTFVVAMPGGLYQTNNFRGALLLKTQDVVLVPDASDIDGIVHEILAACAAGRPSSSAWTLP